MESKPKNKQNLPGTKATARAQIDSCSKPQTQKEQHEELEQLRQEQTDLQALNAEKEALLADMKKGFEALGDRFEEDQVQLKALKQKALERGFIPYEERQQ